MISTYKLTEMYNKWGDEQKLQPLGCALEEIMGNDKLSEMQRNWLIRFVDVWEYAQDREDLLLGDQIAMKKGLRDRDKEAEQEYWDLHPEEESNVTVIEDDDPRYIEDINLKHKMNLKSYFNAKGGD
jgi:hypothetical protein